MPSDKLGLTIILTLATVGIWLDRLPLWSLCMSAASASFFASRIWPQSRNWLAFVMWGFVAVAAFLFFR